jgi:hypothetical protein
VGLDGKSGSASLLAAALSGGIGVLEAAGSRARAGRGVSAVRVGERSVGEGAGCECVAQGETAAAGSSRARELGSRRRSAIFVQRVVLSKAGGVLYARRNLRWRAVRPVRVSYWPLGD